MATNNRVSEILGLLSGIAQLMPLPFESPYAYMRRTRNLGPGDYSHTVWKMQKSGLVKIISKNSKKFIKITKKGELRALLEKSIMEKPLKWDGKWRLIIFDIPEDCREKRNQLRVLLKDNGFIKLQASVFINPYPLNGEAVVYLKKTGLIDYIRIMRVDNMDDDRSLLKKFKLKKHQN